jgi:hypothetical protein
MITLADYGVLGRGPQFEQALGYLGRNYECKRALTSYTHRPDGGHNSPSTQPLDMAAGFSLIAEKFAKRQHATTRVADA